MSQVSLYPQLYTQQMDNYMRQLAEPCQWTASVLQGIPLDPEPGEIPSKSHQRPEAGQYLKSRKVEKKLGNSGVTWKYSGERPSANLSTRENVRHFVKSSIALNMHNKPTVNLASVNASASSLLKVIDTADRPPDARAEGKYARSGTYAMKGANKPGERIPKAGAYAEAGVGRARAEISIFEAEAKGPNACAVAEASAIGVSAIARAEVGSVSASAGPLTAKVGLGVDTGVSVGVDGFEAKILGTGIRVGPKPSISFLGSEVECVIL